MFVDIEESLFNNQNFFNDIDRLISILFNDKHIWIIKVKVDSILKSDWIKNENLRLGKKYKSFIKKAAVKSSNIIEREISNKILIKIKQVTNNEDLTFTVKEAIKVLNFPLHIILENATNDYLFLSKIVSAYSSQEIRKGYNENWIMNENAGGGEGIKNSVERLLSVGQIPQRIIVIRDSDKTHPNHVKQNVEEQKKYLEDNNITFHILYKREIENYIPIEAIENNPDLDQKITNAFKEMTQTQMDFFDMKSGFKNNRNKLSDEVKELFENILNDNKFYTILKNGFGSSITNCFKTQKQYFTKENMEARCLNNKNELKEILSKIIYRL